MNFLSTTVAVISLAAALEGNIFVESNLIVWFIVLTFVGKSQGQVKLTLPEHVVLNGNVNGQCSIEANGPLHIVVFPPGKCKYETVIKQKNSTYSLIQFVIKNVTTTCTCGCLLYGQLKKSKRVSVISTSIFSCVATQKPIDMWFN